ncbi:carbon-nitrogen hydrolase family protein [Sinisalibacter aestuarii]|uniref:Amidohydrolase n=1 Tax=Sinisalibacter aestuarii TaxID=2949426 RepID=A0ABQ5LQY9_9RHOB|nr:carbon-nitrogen hydrolase family protein [Sinisalibacter aestuarii]GKY87424.1 amidohydrolase [Sinisalibacter aestuarii]
MKIATACYPIDWMEGFSCYADKLSSWVAEAAAEGADLLVFPEYAAMEIAAFAGRAVAADLPASLAAVSAAMEDSWALHARLATEHGVHILAGSGPVFEAGRLVNRAMFFTPDGRRQAHDKQIMTRWERDELGAVPGNPLVLMETALGRIGVLICYDAEFPLLARSLVEAGAEVLLVPSQTELDEGYNRVRIGAMARALEGQCVVVHSPTQGRAPWSPLLDENAGAAAIYGPPDRGFPASGVIAQGAMNRPGWVFADVDLAAVRAARADGNVLTMVHWAEQPARANPVQCVALT